MNPKCIYCNSDSHKKENNVTGKRYQCKICKRSFMITDIKNAPNIFVFDIETLFRKTATWGVWQQNIPMDAILQEECMLSWSGKWFNDNEILSDVLTPEEAKKRKDKRIVKSLWKLFDIADVVIAHNGKKFDVRKCNSYFILNGLKPPSPYQIIDTLDVSRKKFSFAHNKLDYLAKLFRKDRKIETDFKLWLDCDKGIKRALNEMLKYNEMDVLVLEEVYRELLPWITSHPNYNLFTNKEVCANCGHDEYKIKGSYNTPVNSYNTRICKKCGAYSVRMGKKLKSIAR